MKISKMIFSMTVLMVLPLCSPACSEEGSTVADIDQLKQRETSYWDNGNVREDTVYDDSGTIRRRAFYREDGTLEELKKYDELGKVTEMINYSEHGRLRQTADGWAAMTFEYKDGNLVTES